MIEQLDWVACIKASSKFKHSNLWTWILIRIYSNFIDERKIPLKVEVYSNILKNGQYL